MVWTWIGLWKTERGICIKLRTVWPEYGHQIEKVHLASSPSLIGIEHFKVDIQMEFESDFVDNSLNEELEIFHT